LRVPRGRHIAYFGPNHTPLSEYPPACSLQDHANGRLSASATKLLESCKALLVIVHYLRHRLARYEPEADVSGEPVNPEEIGVTEMAAAAIAAAEGGVA